MLTKEQRREIQRKLENWALWYYGKRETGASLSPFPAYNLVNPFSPRASGNGIVVLPGEGEDTDRLLRKMPPRLVKVLTVYYLWNGTKKWKAKRCKVAPATFYRLLSSAERAFNRLCYPRHVAPRLGSLPKAA